MFPGRVLRRVFRRSGVLLAWMVLAALLPACASKQAGPETPPDGSAAAAAPTPQAPFLARMFSWTSVFGKLFPRKPRPPVAAPPVMIGEIRQVNAEAGFVLIDAGITVAAQPGDALVTIARQQETSDLKMTALRGGSFLIADIVSGTPAVGERVYKR